MRTMIIVSLLAGLLACAGCADLVLVQQQNNTPPFGESVRALNDSTKVNPKPADPVPVVGLDGEYAKTVMERYQDGPPERKDQDIPSISMRVIGQ